MSSSGRDGLWARLTRNVTWYLLYIIGISVLGPLQFGYHLVRLECILVTRVESDQALQAELNAPQKAITCEVKGDGEDQHSRLPRCIPMDSLRYGLVTSIFTLGGLVGALAAGALSTRYGRLYTMRLASGFFTAGPLLEAFATNVPVFAIGRLLSGLGAGAAIVVVPMYISEIAPPTEKGMFGALTQVSINLGILMTQFLGLFLSKAQLWRVILGVAGGIAVVQFLALFTVVESPQWMSAQGESLRARQTLKRIRNDGYDLDGEVARWSAGMMGMDIGMILASCGSRWGFTCSLERSG